MKITNFLLAYATMFSVAVGTILIVNCFANGYLYGTPLGIGLSILSLKLFLFE